jgi:hypothetical protein
MERTCRRATKDRKSNGLSGSMADAGCSRQSPIAVRHVSRLTERRPKWDRKHCLMHGEWPPAATLHASGTSCPPAPTRRCADRTRSPVRAGLTNPTEDRCQPVPPLLPASHSGGPRAGAMRGGWVDSPIVVEDLAHGSEIIDEGDDAHGCVADRALQRKCLIDARQQHGPEIARHGTMVGLFAGCRRSRRWRNGGRGERRHHSA